MDISPDLTYERDLHTDQSTKYRTDQIGREPGNLFHGCNKAAGGHKVRGETEGVHEDLWEQPGQGEQTADQQHARTTQQGQEDFQMMPKMATSIAPRTRPA
jgi:hypothetical protein